MFAAFGIYLEIQDFSYFSRELSIAPFLHLYAYVRDRMPL